MAAEHLPLPSHGPSGGEGDEDTDDGPGGDGHTVPCTLLFSEDSRAFRKLPANIGISSPVFLKCQENNFIIQLYFISITAFYVTRTSGAVRTHSLVPHYAR